jgi:2',3'-cyclic-nucleotide 2'-phosphodiesterase / 3'-nucleotidase
LEGQNLAKTAFSTLTIVETSDVHGNIFPISYGSRKTTPLGLGKVSTYVKELREHKDNLLVIDNGDLIQGTPLTYHYVKFLAHKPNPMITVLNNIGYDGAVVGNHEFNYGIGPLKSAASQANCPYLSANIVHKATKEPYFGIPYFIKTFSDGLKVAVLGVTTHYIPNWENPKHISDLHFYDAVVSTKRWVGYIREVEQPDVMIVSYHGGFEKDLQTGESSEVETGENQAYRICQEIEGIDVLLTGHQHRQLTGSVNGVTIVQPGYNGQFVGNVTLQLKKRGGEWIIISKSSDLVDLSNFESDEEVLSLVQSYENATQHWLDQPIGKINGNMEIDSPLQARLVEHPWIEFINKVQMESTGADISNTALFNNAGLGLPQHVTMRDIVSNYVYPNTLTVIRLMGQDIRAALERSASYFLLSDDGSVQVNPKFSIPKPQHYNYDMWEGIDYIIDLTKPIGERITKLQYQGNDIEESAQYDVVMNNYRAGGGGEYKMFRDKPVIKDIQIDMTELLANYFLKHEEVKATVNHNWKVITK